MDTSIICYSTAEEAEEAFYQAFQLADLPQMMTVWLDSEEIASIHPMGKIQRGLLAVEEGWRQIFSDGQRMHIEIILQQEIVTETLVTRTVRENIFLHGENHPRPPILATNVFQLTESGWHILLHHASPAVLTNETKTRVKEAPMH